MFGVSADPRRNAETPPVAPSRLWYAGDVVSIAEVEALMNRFAVALCVIDMQPETHLVVDLARRLRGRVVLARYGRQDPGHEISSEHGVRVLKVNRNEAIEEMVTRFTEGTNELPRDARELGGFIKQGVGEYYRETVALRRVMQRDPSGTGRADGWVTPTTMPTPRCT